MKKCKYLLALLSCLVMPYLLFAQNDFEDVSKRTMAEWEELQALMVAWKGQYNILAQIVDYAKEECEVIVVCDNEYVTRTQLEDNYGVDISENVSFLEAPTNTIWIRDYGPNTVYANCVDSLLMVDWIYNRFRPRDDTLALSLSEYIGVPLMQTLEAPNDLVHTGGNFMTDGLGMAFSSKLVLEENDSTNIFGQSNQSEEEIDEIMYQYMGIDEYVKMETLFHDGIHHIDMHMKLLDERTLLVGEYPEGVADGPQIEANIQYVLNNFATEYGEPFDIVRIPMPPQESNGNYPDNYGDYLTYANAVFVNKTILVPTYYEPHDSVALAIWRETMPGYNVQGINCNSIIPSIGAIHCITKEVGVENPLWISHNRISEACKYEEVLFEAQVKHKDGLTEVALFYRLAGTESYTMVPMGNTEEEPNIYSVLLPALNEMTDVEYYIHAEAETGKTINRPMPAPEGYYTITVDCVVGTEEPETSLGLLDIFPNPSAGITCIPIESNKALEATLRMYDVMGRQVKTIFDGNIPGGASKYFIHANQYPAGTYFIHLETGSAVEVRKLIIK